MADNRQFTDHNEIGGVNVYLEDKKLAESPEKNTVASTDYVLLKDTDGVPQKISKANLMGVVKDALADLLKSNDLGTSVTNVPALNASAFGSATVANLASVLGVLKWVNMNNVSNLNTLTKACYGYISVTSISNLPINVAPAYLLVIGNPERVVQICYVKNSSTIEQYCRNWDGTIWSSWVKMN